MTLVAVMDERVGYRTFPRLFAIWTADCLWREWKLPNSRHTIDSWRGERRQYRNRVLPIASALEQSSMCVSGERCVRDF